jgi:DME family drug/metabolite transporter
MGIATWRMGVAGIALLGYLAVAGRLYPRSWTSAMWWRMIITGALTAAFEAAFFTAVELASVGLATLIGIGSAPVFVAAFDAVTTRRRPPGLHLAALGLALVGLALLVGGGAGRGSAVATGAALALFTGATFAAITIVNRAPLAGLGPIALTGGSFAAGALLLAPFTAIGGLAFPSDARGWLLALALGVGITALAYVFFLASLATVPAFVATITTLLEPLIGAVLGAVVLGERLGTAGIVGGALLGTAVVLLRPQRDEPASIH